MPFNEGYKVPESVRNNARRILELKKKHGSAVRGGTSVGWARARQLASSERVSYETVAKMAQFARHLSNAEVDPKYKNEPWKDRGWTALMLWGGKTGVEWARAIMESK